MTDKETLAEQPVIKQDLTPAQPAQQDSTCNKTLREQGKAYPRTCKKCGLGPCIADRVQPAQQEPAGAVYRYGKDSSGKPWHGIRWTASGLDFPDGTLVYTSPQSKPWVGLTDGEWEELADRYGVVLWRPLKSDVEAKLREKNT